MSDRLPFVDNIDDYFDQASRVFRSFDKKERIASQYWFGLVSVSAACLCMPTFYKYEEGFTKLFKEFTNNEYPFYNDSLSLMPTILTRIYNSEYAIIDDQRNPPAWLTSWFKNHADAMLGFQLASYLGSIITRCPSLKIKDNLLPLMELIDPSRYNTLISSLLVDIGLSSDTKYDFNSLYALHSTVGENYQLDYDTLDKWLSKRVRYDAHRNGIDQTDTWVFDNLSDQKLHKLVSDLVLKDEDLDSGDNAKNLESLWKSVQKQNPDLSFVLQADEDIPFASSLYGVLKNKALPQNNFASSIVKSWIEKYELNNKLKYIIEDKDNLLNSTSLNVKRKM